MRTVNPNSGEAAASRSRRGSSPSIGGRRYTPGMGAVETMEDFFEKLNGGDREGACGRGKIESHQRVAR